ncbi:hypothetical protein J6524_19200 [Bradyrhizobium sp. WSM 1738]|nr:hypothetical protein [Bradyrhizobium hereditatis]
MHAAQQQRWRFDFTAINQLHVPVALASMFMVAILFGHGVLRRPFDDVTLLAGTVTLGHPRQRVHLRRDIRPA